MGIAETIRINQDKDGMLRRSLERIIQLYTDKSHFVYELLQNAEDAKAHRIVFTQYSDRLEVMHDGIPFTEENLQGLCDIGKSDKINNLNQIGEFGVGFKSVFGICETVQLYSSPTPEYIAEGYKPFAVEIRDFTNPFDIDQKEIPDEFTTLFVFPYCVGYQFSGFKKIEALNRVLSKRLSDLGITTLLFMNNLELIEYDIRIKGQEETGKYQLNKKIINNHCIEVSATEEESNKKDKHSDEIAFLKFSKPILSGVSNRTIDIAFEMTIDKDGIKHFQKAANPYISVYFPTETESKLDFIIQGPFRTTPNRSSVPADDEENKYLADLAGDLLVDSLVELKKSGFLNIELLKILPIENDRFDVYPLFKSHFEKISKMFRTNDMLPTNKKDVFVDARHALIARNNEMSKLFTANLISELFDDEKHYEWLPEQIKESGTYSKVHAYLTRVLRINSLRPEDLKEKLEVNTRFLKRRNNQWLIGMYNLYNSVPNVFQENKNGNMLETPIIKTKTGKIVAPYRKSEDEYLPNVFLPKKQIKLFTEVELVDLEIYQSCKEFFEHTLRLEEANEYELFIRSLYRHYSLNRFNVSVEQHISDVKQILLYLEIGTNTNDLMEHLRKVFKLKCIKNGRECWSSPFETKILFPVSENGLEIERFYEGMNVNLVFLHFDVYKNNGISYYGLKKLYVTDKIVVDDTITSGAHELGKSHSVPVTWNTYDSNFAYKLNIYLLNSVLLYISRHPNDNNSMLKSQVIFKTLQEYQNRLSGKINVLRDGSPNRTIEEESKIIKILKRQSKEGPGNTWDGKWLYTDENELVSPEEISKRDLNTVLYGELSSDSTLYELLDFFKSEADIYDENEKEYDELSENKKNYYFDIELKRRFGITSKELDNLYRNKTQQKNHVDNTEEYEFPVSNVNNWDTLKKHVAQTIVFASPVTYESVIRSVRISKTASSRDYILNMYRINATRRYACQMCYRPVFNVEACQIEKKPNLELDPIVLCLGPNCAQVFKMMRNDTALSSDFLEKLSYLDEDDIIRDDYVSVPIGNNEIRFTQVHAAEINELLHLKKNIEKDEQKKKTVLEETKQKKTIDVLNETEIQRQNPYQINEEQEKRRMKAEITRREAIKKEKTSQDSYRSIESHKQINKSVATPKNSTSNKAVQPSESINQNILSTMELITAFDTSLKKKTVYSTKENEFGTVRDIDDNYMKIRFTDRNGIQKDVKYSITDCKKYKWIYRKK